MVDDCCRDRKHSSRRGRKKPSAEQKKPTPGRRSGCRPGVRVGSVVATSLDERDRHARLEDPLQAVLQAVDSLLVRAGDDLDDRGSWSPQCRPGVAGRGDVGQELESGRAEVGAGRQVRVEQVAERDRVDAGRGVGQAQPAVQPLLAVPARPSA